MKGYLLRRRGLLYFRMRVPEDLRACLGLSEIRKSLTTGDLKEAKPKAMRLAAVACDIFNHMNMKRRGGIGVMAKMTDEQIRQAARQWLDQALLDEYTARVQETMGRLTPKRLERIRDAYTDAYEYTLEALELKRYPSDVIEHAKVIFDQLCPDEDNPDLDDERDAQFRKLCDALTLAKAAFCESAGSKSFSFDGQLTVDPCWRYSAARMVKDQWYVQQDRPRPQESLQDALKEVLPALLMPSAALSTVGGLSKPVPVSEAVEAYITAKEPTFAISSKRNIFNNIRQFAEAIKELKKGQDIFITQLDRQLMRDFARIMTAQPANPKRKEFKGKTLLEKEAMNIPADQRLTGKTLDTKLTMIKSLLNWCEQEYGIQARPLNSAMVIPKDQRKTENRRAFTHDEIRKLFNPRSYLKATDGEASRYWIPIIALFTGMRLDEIAQLHVTDIRQDEGVWCFDINDKGDGKHVKSEAGKRLVPLHPFLAGDLGFTKFVDDIRAKSPDDPRLFPELKREKKGNLGGAIGKWFTRYRQSVGVGEEAGKHSTAVFHSFRHTVVNHLLTALVAPRLVQKVVGHDATGAADIGITANYEGKYPTATLRDEVIMKLNWAEGVLKQELKGLARR